MTRSPWLIQTGYFSPFFHTPSNSGVSSVTVDLGAAEFAVVPGLDDAAELMRHRLLAVADAEHGHAGVKQFDLACGRRVGLSRTEAGPPERITAFGFIRAKASSAFWNGTISE